MITETDKLQKAHEAARLARENAYARYSGFKVGAALMTKSGTMYSGCNVENASYGATICAERAAVLAANAAGEREFQYIVIVSDAEPPALPCALCLQVFSEFCSPDFEIILATPERIVSQIRFGELLPHPFNEIP